VSSVRLGFAPTRLKARRYVFALKFRGGARFEIDNFHYRGFADFEDRSMDYAAFVRAALRRIAVAAPH
jgi:hypothetical protein